MNKKKQFAAAALAMSVATTVFSGCSGKQTQEADNGTVKLTWWTQLYPHVAQTATNFGEVELYQELSKRTGVELEFIHPTAGQENEQFNIMLSSGDLPDLLERDFTKYKGGPQKAIDEKIIIEIDEYLDQYSPNYKKVLEEHPDWDKQVMTDSGKHYTYAWFRGDDSLMCWSGPQIRKDLLDQAGLPVPETIEEWDTALRAFKDMGVPYPLTSGGLKFNDTFSGAFGISEYYYQDDGVVKLGILEPAYKEYLSLMATWYQDGLLDPDFFAQDAKTLDSKIASGKVGAYIGAAGSSMGNYIPLLQKQGATLVGTKYPVMKKGDQPEFGQKDFAYYPMTSVAITTKCENKEAAAKFLDYGYSEEGHMLYNFGIEGVSYEMVDGYPKYTELITNNPDNLTMQHAMGRYMASAYGGPFIQDKRYYEQYLPYEEQKEAVSLWSQQTGEHRIPTVSYTPEETEIIANVGTETSSFVDESLLKFITGQTSMDQFDQFVEELKKLGIEKLIAANQSALERYNSR